jgi:hypothetical protein
LIVGFAVTLAAEGNGETAARMTAAAIMPPPRTVAVGSRNDPDVVDRIKESFSGD